MKSNSKRNDFSQEEKELVAYFKDKLKSRGITKFPRDWHLKQLSVARYLLSGDKPPSLDEWKSCIDWAFGDPYWGDKVDHLARIEALWPKYMLKHGGAGGGGTAKAGRTAPKRGSWGTGRRGNRHGGKDDPLPF